MSAALRGRARLRRWPRRTGIAAAVVAGTVASLLLGWYWAGAADVAARAQLARQRPMADMRARVATVADELRRDLDDVLRRESQRPYYHYGNLFRDPRGASTGLALSPSPLASGPSEPLVSDHFQIDAGGAVTLPTINDDVPELSDVQRLAEHRQARQQLTAVAASLRASVLDAVVDSGTEVAAIEPAKPSSELGNEQAQGQAPPWPDEPSKGRASSEGVEASRGKPVKSEDLPTKAKRVKSKVESQVERLDPEVYAQNAAPTQVYQNIVSQQRVGPKVAPGSRPSMTANEDQSSSSIMEPEPRSTRPRTESLGQRPLAPPVPPVPTPSPNALRNVEGGRITIVTAPLAWHTVSLAAQPTLVAVREVSTPDGRLVQGLVVDRAALERWLVDREVDEEVRLINDGDSRAGTRASAASSTGTSVGAGSAPGSASESGSAPGSASASGTASATGTASASASGTASGSTSGTASASASSADARADSGLVTVVGPWSLVATPTAAAVAAAAARATAIERGFLLRFGAVAIAAALAGAFVVLLMASAERLARERSQFAAAAAHELRTPLAGLQLYGDMLADGLGDPSKARDYARRLSEEAARLGRVVSNVLGFSQLERGNLTLEPRDGDVVEVIRDLVARAEPALDRLGVVVDLAIPAALPARFDRDAVVRILGNLLDNAEKYGRAAEDRTITLAAVATAEGAQLTVRDHGPGIAPETARRLFRPFARGAGPDGPAGLGLGLALSRSLAEAMGGSLTYRRVDDQTEFTLRLPVAGS